MNIGFALRRVGGFLVKKAPTILAWAGVAGVWGTAYALHHTDEKVRVDDLKMVRENIGFEEAEDDDTVYHGENVKKHWKGYALTAGLGIASSACIILGDRTSCKRIAQLSAAVVFANQKIRDYRASIRDKYGDDILKEIDQDVIRRDLQRKPVADSESDIPLWYEPETGMTFELPEEDFENARIAICADYVANGVAFFNDWLGYLHQPESYEFCSYGWGNDGGWMQGPYMKISWELANDKDGRELRVINYGENYSWPCDSWLWWNDGKTAAEEWRWQFFRLEEVDPVFENQVLDAEAKEPNPARVEEAAKIRQFFKDEKAEPDYHIYDRSGPGQDLMDYATC